VSTAFFVIYTTWTMAPADGMDDPPTWAPWVGLGIVLVVWAALATVSVIAWFALRKGKTWAQAWAIAASVLSLPVLGIGTIAGILGLVVFTRKDVVAQMAIDPKAAEAPRIQGDGTSKFVDRFATGAQIAVFVVASYFWNVWGRAQGLPETRGTLGWIIPLLIAQHLSVLVHELGHVLGGWASHMKLRHLVLGPFEWAVRGGKWEFSVSAAGLWGRGLTGMVPTTLKDLRGQRVFTTLGGPLGSLFIGCVGLMGALSAKGNPWEPWWEGCTMLATLGLSAFVYNLIPLRPQDQYSDGAHLYQLLSRGPWADVHMAFSVVSSTVATPLRPRDLDINVIQRAADFLKSGKQGLLLRLFQYIHHMDAGRIEEALEAIAEAEALYPELASKLDADLHADFVFVNALFRRDLEAARLWWQRMEAKGGTKFKVDYWKARTALLWLEGCPEAAEEAWQKGNAFAQKLPAAGAYEFDRWCYRTLREALDAPGIYALVPPPLPAPHRAVVNEAALHEVLMPEEAMA
jgi:Zn-dependent protease